MTEAPELRVAYELLSKPDQRAQYDVTYDDEKGHQWRIFDQAAAADAPDRDRTVFHGILSLLYVARRRDPENGGLGPIHLERTLGVPREHLEFPLWYLMKRGWIERLLGGRLAITVDGVDVLGNKELSLPGDHLLEESRNSPARQRIGKDRRLLGNVAPTTDDPVH